MQFLTITISRKLDFVGWTFRNIQQGGSLDTVKRYEICNKKHSN